MCIVVTIGTVIQTASVNIGMFLAGRVLAGYAVGYSPIPHMASMLCVSVLIIDKRQGTSRHGTHLPQRNLRPAIPRLNRRHIRLRHLTRNYGLELGGLRL